MPVFGAQCTTTDFLHRRLRTTTDQAAMCNRISTLDDLDDFFGSRWKIKNKKNYFSKFIIKELDDFRLYFFAREQYKLLYFPSSEMSGLFLNKFKILIIEKQYFINCVRSYVSYRILNSCFYILIYMFFSYKYQKRCQWVTSPFKTLLSLKKI